MPKESETTVCLTHLETVHGPESYESLHQVTFFIEYPGAARFS